MSDAATSHPNSRAHSTILPKFTEEDPLTSYEAALGDFHKFLIDREAEFEDYQAIAVRVKAATTPLAIESFPSIKRVINASNAARKRTTVIVRQKAPQAQTQLEAP